MKNKQYRQGDVLIELVNKRALQPFRDCKRLTRVVLAEGEATGHAHVLHTQEKDPADWWKTADDEQFVSISEPAQVKHEEHAAIEVPKGTYQIIRQREYSPEAIRNVAD